MFYSWAPDKIVLKVPMRADGSGLELTRMFRSMRMWTNLTALMNAEQAILGIKAGANYISFFYKSSKRCRGGYQRILAMC